MSAISRMILALLFGLAVAGGALAMADDRGASAVSLDLSYAKRVALVIGNGAYEHSEPLANPANDAGDIAELLRQLGFTVVDGYDLGRAAMAEKVVAFSEVARDAGVTLFYYAGHGMQVDGRNYLLPVDAALQNEAAIPFQTVALDTVLASMTDEKRIAIALLDACRDNPLAGRLSRTRSAGASRGLAVPETGGGVMIGFATAPGATAADGDGRNSPFAAALLRHLATSGMEISRTMKRVMADVSAATGGTQRPWVHSDISADFFMAPDGAPPPSSLAEEDAGRPEAEVEIAALPEPEVHASRATRIFDHRFGVFEGEEFDLCGYPQFKAELTGAGNSSVRLSSLDRSVPGRTFRGYEKTLPLNTAVDLWEDCAVLVGLDNRAGISRLQISVSKRR